MAYAFNPSNQEAEAGDFWEFEANLVYKEFQDSLSYHTEKQFQKWMNE